MTENKEYRRVWKLVRFLVVMVATLLVLVLVRNFLLDMVIARCAPEDFSAVHLSRGQARQTVLDELGEPGYQLQERGEVGEVRSELLGFKRGEYVLEITLVDGKVQSWVASGPLAVEKQKGAKTQAIPCCGDDENTKPGPP